MYRPTLYITCTQQRRNKNNILGVYYMYGDAVALLVGHRTCDLHVACSSPASPGWAPLRSGLGQATSTCMPLSPSGIIWYRPWDDLWLGK